MIRRCERQNFTDHVGPSDSLNCAWCTIHGPIPPSKELEADDGLWVRTLRQLLWGTTNVVMDLVQREATWESPNGHEHPLARMARRWLRGASWHGLEL